MVDLERHNYCLLHLSYYYSLKFRIISCFVSFSYQVDSFSLGGSITLNHSTLDCKSLAVFITKSLYCLLLERFSKPFQPCLKGIFHYLRIYPDVIFWKIDHAISERDFCYGLYDSLAEQIDNCFKLAHPVSSLHHTFEMMES